jgi:hypothetical protein
MLEQHTKVLVERLKLAEEAALAGDEMAIRLYVSDARQMVSEFRQSRKLFARDRVRQLLVVQLSGAVDQLGYLFRGCDSFRVPRRIKLIPRTFIWQMISMNNGSRIRYKVRMLDSF